MQNAPPFGLSDCFPRDEFEVHYINRHSPANGFLCLLRLAMSQHLCLALSLAGGIAWWSRAPHLPNIPTAHSPCHCPPCPVGTEPQSYFKPFCGGPGLGKSEVLAAGHNCFPESHEGHCLGLAPLVWWPSPLVLVPFDPQ